MIFPTPIPDELLPECEDDDLMCHLDRLYKLHSLALWRAFYAKCGDRERSDDAVHEAFLRLYAAGVHDVKSPMAWMLKVGNNWLIDLARRARRQASSSSDLSYVAGDEDPEDDAIDVEQHQLIREAMHDLRDRDRKLLALRYTLNWNSAEIACHLGIKTDAVDMRLVRARRRLAKVLEERGLSAMQLM